MSIGEAPERRITIKYNLQQHPATIEISTKIL